MILQLGAGDAFGDIVFESYLVHLDPHYPGADHAAALVEAMESIRTSEQ